LDKVSDETAKELSNLFGEIIGKLCGLCTERGLIFSVIGPQLLHVLIPVLMEVEYELVREHEMIEIIHDHILYVLHHKMENDSSLKQRFKWNKISNGGQSMINSKLDKIQNNLLNDDDNVIMDKIQKSLLDALKFLVNQLYRSNSSKLRHKRSSKAFENEKKEKGKDKEQKLKIYHESEEYVLCKLMDVMPPQKRYLSAPKTIKF